MAVQEVKVYNSPDKSQTVKNLSPLKRGSGIRICSFGPWIEGKQNFNQWIEINLKGNNYWVESENIAWLENYIAFPAEFVAGCWAFISNNTDLIEEYCFDPSKNKAYEMTSKDCFIENNQLECNDWESSKLYAISGEYEYNGRAIKAKFYRLHKNINSKSENGTLIFNNTYTKLFYRCGKRSICGVYPMWKTTDNYFLPHPRERSRRGQVIGFREM
ncbi:hypothetical protein EHQ13_10155 [Leptospira gomenensis]|uniref:Uncharacterized protein n=1 Tax=Leptospira gomenensis TaxID=2484974 RepID=A0A5F1Y9K2_9LEPT|nr:hypothetical protein [Leptospira gomenensis]TGK32508.1 hypothetical protein EHQ17_12550 [Leptospira gomenensis]TGK42528.1 hypothetical protein EHQ07_14750 [Leptospira gomenensis]TGK60814.1 hypothetical protein EHQ13_10155 [Leptospira gomenensis]